MVLSIKDGIDNLLCILIFSIYLLLYFMLVNDIDEMDSIDPSCNTDQGVYHMSEYLSDLNSNA